MLVGGVRVDWKAAQSQVSHSAQQMGRLARILGELSRFDADPAANAVAIRQRLGRVTELLRKIKLEPEFAEALRSQLGAYETAVAAAEQQVSQQFAAQLDALLRPADLALSGYHPDYRTWFLTVEAKSEAHRVVVWYGPKDERLAECTLSASAVAKVLVDLRKRLGSGLPPEEYLSRLKRAWRHATVDAGEPRVPLAAVLPHVALQVQDARFMQNPRRENFRPYGRADFSYDMFRLRDLPGSALIDSGLHLSVATRAFTRRKQDFLWVPENESLRGTPYSHLEFRGQDYGRANTPGGAVHH